jgi:hypothetical protein
MEVPEPVPGDAEGIESHTLPRHDGTAHDTMLEENSLLRNTQHASTFESAAAQVDNGDVSVDTLPNPPSQSTEIMQLLNELHTGIQSATRTALAADPYLAELLLNSGMSFENTIATIGAVRSDDDARLLVQTYAISPIPPSPSSYSPPQLPVASLLRHTNNAGPRNLASVKAAAAVHLPSHRESHPEAQGLPSRAHSEVGGVFDPTPFRTSTGSSHTQLRSRALSGFDGAAPEPGQPASGTCAPPFGQPPPSSTARALDGRLGAAGVTPIELSNVAALSAAAGPLFRTVAGHGIAQSEPIFPGGYVLGGTPSPEHRAFSEADMAALEARGPAPLPVSLLDSAPLLLTGFEHGLRGAALTGNEVVERAANNVGRQ